MAVFEKERESDKKNDWWLTRTAKGARKDRLKISERAAEMFALLALGLE